MTALDRFLAKVEMPSGPDGCWIWIAAKSKAGYGKFWFGPERGQGEAHRFSYETFVGPIPADLELDHFRCDRRDCVNPYHVRPVTVRENSLRGNGFAARNRAKTHCPAGHPLELGNLRADRLRTGRRTCLTCARERERNRPTRPYIPEQGRARSQRYRTKRKAAVA